jgi:hypothetical protein
MTFKPVNVILFPTLFAYLSCCHVFSSCSLKMYKDYASIAQRKELSICPQDFMSDLSYIGYNRHTLCKQTFKELDVAGTGSIELDTVVRLLNLSPEQMKDPGKRICSHVVSRFAYQLNVS